MFEHFPTSMSSTSYFSGHKIVDKVGFSHLDFITAGNVGELVYADIIDRINFENGRGSCSQSDSSEKCTWHRIKRVTFLPKFPPLIIHFWGRQGAVKKSPSVLVNSVSKRQESNFFQSSLQHCKEKKRTLHTHWGKNHIRKISFLTKFTF